MQISSIALLAELQLLQTTCIQSCGSSVAKAARHKPELWAVGSSKLLTAADQGHAILLCADLPHLVPCNFPSELCTNLGQALHGQSEVLDLNRSQHNHQLALPRLIHLIDRCRPRSRRKMTRCEFRFKIIVTAYYHNSHPREACGE